MRCYQYSGLIGQSEHPGNRIVLDDILDDTEPPVGLSVLCSGLAEYLEDRGWTDEEERYITQTWIYDCNLVLQAVVIPSTEPGIPAKVIACADPSCYSDIVRFFGPVEYITEPDPHPMDRDDYAEWREFQLKYRLLPLN